MGSPIGKSLLGKSIGEIAILKLPASTRRLKVVEDTIAIRTMGYLAIGFDHRIIDGAIADQFMSQIKKTLENFDPRLV